MRLGFDLDKVFIDYPPFIPSKLIDRLYKKKSNGLLLYRIPSRKEQLFRLLTHHPLLRPPIKKNIAILKKMAQKDKKNKHFLISSRFKFLQNPTKQLMQKHKFHTLFDEMFFNFENKQPHFFKDSIIKKLNIDRYIDDDFHLVEYLALRNPKTLFFWLNPYEKKKHQENLVGITSLEDIFH